MRRTAPHNPRGFERWTWNYRVLQMRHALGWTQKKLARVSGVSYVQILKLEWGLVHRPELETIRKLKNVEKAYADVISQFKKHPVRFNRLRPIKRDGVRLLPIKVRRPEDLESLGKVEASSDDMFFGRNSRKRMRETGLSVQQKAYRTRKRKAITRGIHEAIARRKRLFGDDKEAQFRQSNDTRRGKDGLG